MVASSPEPKSDKTVNKSDGSCVSAKTQNLCSDQKSNPWTLSIVDLISKPEAPSLNVSGCALAEAIASLNAIRR